MENQEPPNIRGLIMTVSEKMIDYIRSTDNADNTDIIEADTNAVMIKRKRRKFCGQYYK